MRRSNVIVTYMKNILIYAGIAVVVLVGGFFALNSYIYNEKQADFVPGETAEATGTILAIDTEQAIVDGPVVITLETENGTPVTIAVPSMGLPLCPAYQANNIGDVYLLSAGDEIEVRGTVSEDGSIVPCESADHYFRTTPIVIDDFEGEADPKKMSLGMKTWVWERTEMNDGTVVVPAKPGVFTVTFLPDGRLGVGTDCNSVGGSYTAEGGSLFVTDMISTQMYCEGSQEGIFTTYLQDATTFTFTSKGELILDLKYDSGSVIFR